MIRDFIFLVLFFVLIGVWLLAWVAFHVAGGLIHLLLIVAVISLLYISSEADQPSDFDDAQSRDRIWLPIARPREWRNYRPYSALARRRLVRGLL